MILIWDILITFTEAGAEDLRITVSTSSNSNLTGHLNYLPSTASIVAATKEPGAYILQSNISKYKKIGG